MRTNNATNCDNTFYLCRLRIKNYMIVAPSFVYNLFKSIQIIIFFSSKNIEKIVYVNEKVNEIAKDLSTAKLNKSRPDTETEHLCFITLFPRMKTLVVGVKGTKYNG